MDETGMKKILKEFEDKTVGVPVGGALDEIKMLLLVTAFKLILSMATTERMKDAADFVLDKGEDLVAGISNDVIREGAEAIFLKIREAFNIPDNDPVPVNP